MVIKITPNEKGNPPGKLADAELHFTEGALEGLKLIGFSVWERRSGNGRNVTFPARQYVVKGASQLRSPPPHRRCDVAGENSRLGASGVCGLPDAAAGCRHLTGGVVIVHGAW